MGYINIFILVIVYLLLLEICHTSFKKIFIIPETLFLSGFIIQLVYAWFYVKKWDLNISIDTMLVYIIGAVSFCVASIFFRIILLKKVSGTQIQNTSKTTNEGIFIEKLKLWITIIFHIVAIILTSQAIMKVTNAKNLQQGISIYGMLSKDRGISLPQVAGKMNMVSYLSGFVWVYYLVHSFVYKYKGNRVLLLINLLLSFASNILTGSRGGIIHVIISGILIYYILWKKKCNWKSKIPKKVLVTIGVCTALLVILFPISLRWIGRTSTTKSTKDYIALYLSAELKNIDIRITEDNTIKYSPMDEWITLNKLFSKLSNWFGGDVIRRYANAKTYVNYNNNSLGNVYTIYYSYISDLGYLGLPFFGSIMAFVCQLSLVKMMQDNNNKHIIQMNILIYAYILTMTFFSFFSNWFYEFIFSTGFVWCIIVCFSFRYFIEDLKISKKNLIKMPIERSKNV